MDQQPDDPLEGIKRFLNTKTFKILWMAFGLTLVVQFATSLYKVLVGAT